MGNGYKYYKGLIPMNVKHNTQLLWDKYINQLDNQNVWEHINRDSRRLFELASKDKDGEQMKEVMFKVIEIFEILSK